MPLQGARHENLTAGTRMQSDYPLSEASRGTTTINPYRSFKTACLYALATIAILGAPHLGRAQSSPLADADIRRRADALLQQMTVEEKAGQLLQSSGVAMEALPEKTPDAEIQQGRFGSILWLIDVKEINRLQPVAVDQTRR